jgi:hypothetical protein
MQAKAFEGQPYYPNRAWGEFDLICMVAVALLTISVTRGKLGERRRSMSLPDPALA